MVSRPVWVLDFKYNIKQDNYSLTKKCKLPYPNHLKLLILILYLTEIDLYVLINNTNVKPPKIGPPLEL